MEEPTQQEDDITDIDLYGDLHLDIAQQISYDEMKAKCEEQELTINDLQKENSHLKEQNEILKKNISSLYLTARNEITRKDAEIKRLQDIEIRHRTRYGQKRQPTKDGQSK
ncbi:Hypothetical predicted protein [Paramuricea clavata]|uniref:Uncharacterized protein n=1 Tax=Paramuricea clavata TaxID=317549 RepID=A0A6S7HR46_PARCT|nr:Hypothetical predicted protein [Paramuricea clavata]